jgi:leucyl-tRNA synthetase
MSGNRRTSSKPMRQRKRKQQASVPAQIHEKFPKWFGNFPYPYMNGSLHLGHAFTISKIEFAAGYQRLLGKRVLFPHGFHVTGMPIKVRHHLLPSMTCPERAIRHLRTKSFGRWKCLARISKNLRHQRNSMKSRQRSRVTPPSPASTKGRKGKLAAKSTGLTYQFQIMESIGVPRSEIKKFADPYYWLTYFPPIAIVSFILLSPSPH